MGSITNYSFLLNKLKLHDKFIDFKLSNLPLKEIKVLNDYLIADFRVESNYLISDIWEERYSSEEIIPYYGLTGIDNGAVQYVDINTLINSNLNLENNIKLLPVNGFRRNINYNLNIIDDTIEFRGGFMQGFYKIYGYKHNQLPCNFNNGFSISLKIKPVTNFSETDTLNTINPNNKGFFFYIGPRSENKFWNEFNGLNPDLDTIKESTYDGIKDQDFTIPLNPPVHYIKEETNQFLIYGRANPNNSDFGFGTKIADYYNKNESLKYITRLPKKESEVNPFLLYGRSNGTPINSNDESYHNDYVTSDGEIIDYGTKIASKADDKFTNEKSINVYKDIYNSMLGFKVDTDGRIGVKTISEPTCDDENYNVVMKWTKRPILKNDSFNDLFISIDPYSDNECNIMFYTKTSFDYITKIKWVPKEFDDNRNKQLGVPYNISIGGGSQGLYESITFDGPDPSDDNLPIFKEFGGSFIGDIKDIKMYNTSISKNDIK